MAGLTEHVLLNKWDDDINEAITAVGGDTSKSSGLPDYSKIIRTQLVANNAIGEGIPTLSMSALVGRILVPKQFTMHFDNRPKKSIFIF